MGPANEVLTLSEVATIMLSTVRNVETKLDTKMKDFIDLKSVDVACKCVSFGDLSQRMYTPQIFDSRRFVPWL
jgi:hypothetical protein